MILNKKYLILLSLVIALTFLFGCAGLEFAPKKGVWMYPKELVSADKAVQTAQKSGKDKECPAEFKDAKAATEKAYDTYLGCNTKEAIAMAKDAEAKTTALCPKHPKVIAKFTLTINFDFDKSKIRKSDKEQLQKAIEFIKKYPNNKVILQGHTCSIGSKKYNLKLSERRAVATKNYLVKNGAIDPQKIRTEGLGEEVPIASNKTKIGREKNRRVEILILES